MLYLRSTGAGEEVGCTWFESWEALTNQQKHHQRTTGTGESKNLIQARHISQKIRGGDEPREALSLGNILLPVGSQLVRVHAA